MNNFGQYKKEIKFSSNGALDKHGNNFNKLFRFSAWFMLILSIVAIPIGIILIITGLTNRMYYDVVPKNSLSGWSELGYWLVIIIGLLAIIISIPRLIASICAFRYMRKKSNKRIIACFVPSISVFIIGLLFILVSSFVEFGNVGYHYFSVGILIYTILLRLFYMLVLMIPDILFLCGCRLERQGK